MFILFLDQNGHNITHTFVNCGFVDFGNPEYVIDMNTMCNNFHGELVHINKYGIFDNCRVIVFEIKEKVK